MIHDHKDIRFDKRAATYDSGFSGRFSRLFYQALLDRVKAEPGDRLLDVGCGAGTLLDQLVSHCAVAGYGVDVEPEMIAVARRRHPKLNLQVAGCDNLPFDDDTFDVVTVCMAYHHFDDREGFAGEAARVLKPGGWLYIADPRFPSPLRQVMNRLLRAHHTVGRFETPAAIAAAFSPAGFRPTGIYRNGFVQAVELRLAG